MLDDARAVDPKTEELIHLVIDRAATPAEVEQFERVIAESESARQFFGAMTALDDKLKTLPAPAPPADFVQTVIARIKAFSQPVSIFSRRSASPKTVRRRNALFFTWAAAAAIVAGVALYPLIIQNVDFGISSSQVAATMVKPEDAHAAESWPVVARAASSEPGTSLTLRASGDELAVFPSFPEKSADSLSLRWNREKLDPVTATSAVQTPAQAAGVMTFSQGQASRHLVFRKHAGATGPVTFSLTDGEREIARVSMELN